MTWLGELPSEKHEREMTDQQKAFNATPAGQRAMCMDALSRGVVMILNSKVRSLGGEAWDDNAIATANESTLRAIREDLLPIYNQLVAPCGLPASKTSGAS